MPSNDRSFVLAGAAVLVLLTGCASRGSVQNTEPQLELEQGSFRMMTVVEPDGTVSLARNAPLLGRLEIAPIIEAEGTAVANVQIMVHRGRYYITADEFLNIWEVSPSPGETQAVYRPIAVSGEALAGVRLSRFGSPERVCVRVDLENAGPYYINSKGKIDDECS